EIEESLSGHDVLILSDYGKGSLKLVEKILTVAKQHKMTVLVDPKGNDFSRYSGATMITPNLNEFELVAGKIGDDSDLEAKAMDLIRTYNVQQILVTLSDKGMKLFDRDSPSIHSHARSREVYDVSGAGDTVIAVMAMCMAAKFGLSDAMSVANSAAGVVVSKLGTATATMHELKTAITRDAGK
ncbi:MAG: PfkB family carbohydrate kinase, partial [Arenicellales bacterium]